MKIALVPGSFDPVTKGHVYLAEKAAALFDKVYVTVMQNDAKTYLFSPEERLWMVQEAICHIPNAEADIHAGMLWEYARDKGVCAIVKGIRTAQDLLYEQEMAEYNAARYPGAVTVFLPAKPDLQDISSTLVRNTAAAGGDVSRYVTAETENKLKNKYRGISK